MSIIYCDVCNSELSLDEDGEVIGGCPLNNQECEHAAYVPDDEYLPLNFHKDEE